MITACSICYAGSVVCAYHQVLFRKRAACAAIQTDFEPRVLASVTPCALRKGVWRNIIPWLLQTTNTTHTSEVFPVGTLLTRLRT